MTQKGKAIRLETEKFTRELQRIAKKLDRKLWPDMLRKVAFDLLARVIKKNPVDTGRSRAAWTPYLAHYGQPYPRTGTGFGEGFRLGTFAEKFRRNRKFVAVTNAVRYILALEFGHSSQAPGGMLRVSMKEMRQAWRAPAEKAIKESVKR